jgi:hypothetical protein
LASYASPLPIGQGWRKRGDFYLFKNGFSPEQKYHSTRSGFAGKINNCKEMITIFSNFS